MSLTAQSLPSSRPKKETSYIMRHVMYATVPALLVSTWAFGFDTVLNVVWCMLLAVSLEAACLKLRNKPIRFYLNDYSAMLTGLLLGLSIPPFAPWWLSLIGMVFAIPIAKHLYGGLGSNPFNPAMVGYAILLVSFPIEMMHWASPNEPVSPYMSWTAINIAYVSGGVYLLYRRIITWHIPVSLLAALSLLSTAFFLWNNTHYTSPLTHLLSGTTMMAAFFIATDPVTAATSKLGRLIYGAGIGMLIYVIRTWGNYPGSIAFAVLLMNFAAPTIDYLLHPRSSGHDSKSLKNTEKPS